MLKDNKKETDKETVLLVNMSTEQVLAGKEIGSRLTKRSKWGRIDLSSGLYLFFNILYHLSKNRKIQNAGRNLETKRKTPKEYKTPSLYFTLLLLSPFFAIANNQVICFPV